MEIIKTKILQLKDTMTEESINQVEVRISKLEHRSFEIIQSNSRK